MKLKIKVVPRSSRASIAGWIGDTLKVCVKSAPEKGKANRAAQEVIAAKLGLPKQNVRVVSGFGSARKLVEISELSELDVKHRLAAN
ncbi:MAG TPA: DUF167 domain-containing protein [Burkholderiales bacterium]|nr:DUF167 domain-containing protein [Burkholderiales bacterium]